MKKNGIPRKQGRMLWKLIYPVALLIILLSLILTMAVPVGAAADTYRPNSDATVSSYIFPNGGSTHYGRVNDSSDTTYVFTYNKDWHYDLYGLPDHSAALNGITTINSVTVWARVWRESYEASASGQPSARTYLRINSANFAGAETTLAANTWVNISTIYDHVPGTTSTAWTWTDIDNLQAGVGLESPGYDHWIYQDWKHSHCSEVWVTVNYSYNTSTSVASNINPSNIGDSVTFTATVTRAGGSGTPSGTVIFKDGALILGNGTLSGSDGSATATYSTSALSVGSHSITAVYAGDSNFPGSTSAPYTQVVKPFNIITTGNASGVTLTGATLNGSLSNFKGTTVGCYFEYGTSTSYGSHTVLTSLYDNGSFSRAISGLTTGTTYHFRAAAYDYSTSSYIYGEDNTFTPQANLVITNDATSITNTGATLNGSLINANGSNVACYFQYGTTTSYGSDTSSSSESLFSNGSFSRAISGLTEGTTYHYRAAAYRYESNTYVFGEDKTFIAEAATYTVTFNANGGGTPSPTSKSVTYDSAYGTLATTSRTGYTFAGWFTDASAGSQVTAATIVSTASNHTLYAHWTANNYTVTFNSNGGSTPSQSSINVTYGSAYGTLATTTRGGYTFEGWFTDASAGSQVTASTVVTTAADHSLYAHWTAITSTVTFNANGGDTPSMTSKSVTYGSPYGTLATTSRTGYTFAGWFTDATLGNTEITASSTVWAVADSTLYARWTAIDYTLTVTVAPEAAITGGCSVTGASATYHYGDSVSLTPNAGTGWEFVNWTGDQTSGSFNMPASNVSITATFSQTLNSYTITWNNWNGSQLEQDLNVDYGTTPTYDSAVPIRDADAQYSYTFTGWTPSVDTVTGDQTYTAAFSQTLNSYTITWNNWNDSLLEQDLNVDYGTTPSYDSAEPTKPATAQYTYTFTGWTPTVDTVTGDQTYTAAFSQTLNSYTITWNNWDDSLLELDLNVDYGTIPTYDSAEPTKPATAQYTYTFDSWDPTISTVSGDQIYTATFSQTLRSYTITWNNWDGTQLEQDLNVNYGTTPTYDSAVPTKPATAQYTYTFTGWTPTVDTVTGDQTYTAAFSQTLNNYTITWNNWNDSLLEQDLNVDYGTTPTYDSAVPIRDADAQYSYTFTGWNPTVDTVTGDQTYTAAFSQTLNSYTIIWNNWNDSLLEQDLNVDYGTTPSYDSAEPTKPADLQYTYAFDSWNPTISSVTGDQIYTATFTPTYIEYTLTINIMGSGSVDQSPDQSTYHYGDVVTLAPSADTGWTFASFSANVNSSNEVTIDGDTTVDATFTNTPPVADVGGPYSGDEGSAIAFDASASYDPDAFGGIVQYDWDWANDETFEDLDAGAAPTHTWNDNGSPTVAVRVTDNGGLTHIDTATVTVNNVAPVYTLPLDQTALEGTGKSFDIGSFNDPGADSPWSIVVDWGDSTATTEFDATAAGALSNKSHTYADDGTYTVTVTVTDKDGESDSDTFDITVNNVAPDYTAPSDQSSDEGISKSFDIGSFSDPGADNPWSIVVDWGDSTATTEFDATAAGALSNKSHTYADDGTYTVTVTITDKDGESDSDTFDITVNNVAPDVDGDPEDQDVQYSDPIEPIEIEATDVADDELSISTEWKKEGDASFTEGLFDDLSLTAGEVTDNGDGTSTGTWTIDGIANVPAGTYIIRITVEDEDGGSAYYDVNIVVEKEIVYVKYIGDTFEWVNKDEQPGTGDEKTALNLKAILREDDDGNPGNLKGLDVTFSLDAIIGDDPAGSPYDAIVYDSNGNVQFTTPVEVATGLYEILVQVDDNAYYTSAIDIRTISVPDWAERDSSVNGSGDIVDYDASFGFDVQYGKKSPTGFFNFYYYIEEDGIEYEYIIKNNSWAKGGLMFDGEYQAYFESKATVKKIRLYDQENVYTSGNGRFYVEVLDYEDPDDTGEIAVTIWDGKDIAFEIGTLTSKDSPFIGEIVDEGGNVIVIP